MNTAKRPNIIFINTDQQSSTMLSCAGNPHLKTPAMDRIANEGIRFQRAYCSNPVCLPSRFSWFTGRMPSELDIWHNKNPHIEQVPAHIMETCAPRLLKDAGYKVAYGGKVHLPGDMSPESMGCENISEDKRDSLAESSAAYIKRQAEHADAPFFLSVCLVNPHDICFMGMRDYVRTVKLNDADLNKNERWLLSDDSEEMSELNTALQIPEGMSEEEFFDKHCPPLPPNHQPQEDEAEAVTNAVTNAGFRNNAREHWDDKTWRMHRWAYCRLTERVDGQVQIILDALDEAGLTDDTLIIFTSDHGDHDSSHKLDQKTIFYEEAARIPLLMRWPNGITAGQVDEEYNVSCGLDVLPTVCDAAGCTWPDELLGESLLPLARAETPAAFREVLPIECSIGRAIKRGPYKYMRFNDGASAEQLMDLDKDPYETKNHRDDPALQSVLQQCRADFERLYAAV